MRAGQAGYVLCYSGADKLHPQASKRTYFGGAGGFSPVVFVSFVVSVVDVPPGPDADFFSEVFDFSPQPARPIAITQSRTRLNKRFIFHSSVKGVIGPIQHRHAMADCQLAAS